MIGILSGIWHAIAAVYTGFFSFVASPTGHWQTDIPVFIFTYLSGWFATSLALTMWEVHTTGTVMRCSRQRNLDEWSCQKQAQHGDGCWRSMPVRLTAYEKRTVAKKSFGIALLWPLAFFAAVVFGPILIVAAGVWLAFLKPAALGSAKIGESIVSGAVSVSEKTVDYVVQRMDDIETEKLKALEAPKPKAKVTSTDHVLEDAS